MVLCYWVAVSHLRQRGRFTMKLMKLKLQGPFQCPGRGPSNDLESPEILVLIYEINLVEVFPYLTTVQKFTWHYQ
jgi:hypothetical protein